MYNHLTGELDSSIAKLPDALQQPRVMDMVLGQYALVSLRQIWVNEHDEVRIDGTAAVETVESKTPHESHVYVVMLNQGIVVDLLEEEQEKPIKFGRIPTSSLMDDEDFDISNMKNVVWVVNTEREQVHLREIYKEQTTSDLYGIPYDPQDESTPQSDLIDNTETEVVAEPTTEPKVSRRRLFGGKNRQKVAQQTSDSDDITVIIENY